VAVGDGVFAARGDGDDSRMQGAAASSSARGPSGERHEKRRGQRGEELAGKESKWE
jgi:hypothetical protein